MNINRLQAKHVVTIHWSHKADKVFGNNLCDKDMYY